MRFSVSNHAEYGVFKKSGRPCWYCRFWRGGRWVSVRSTGVPTDKPKKDAEKIAVQLLRAGILDEPDTQGGGQSYIGFLKSFWAIDGGYSADRKAEGKPLALQYLKANEGDIRLHIAPYAGFKNKRLDEITTGDIVAWRTWARATQGLSVCRSNAALKLQKVALAQAARRGIIGADPAASVKFATETAEQKAAKEKGVLNADEVRAYIADATGEPLAKAAFLLGMCGLRRGEVRGLLWADIENGIIHVRHNWIDGEGMKPPKSKKPRQVPLPDWAAAALEALPRVNDFVFPSLKNEGQPMSGRWFEKSFDRELARLGVNKKERRLSLHSLRHGFITLTQQGGASMAEAAALAGHASLTVTARYTHAQQALDMDAARARMNALGAGLALGALAGATAARQGGRP